MNQSYKIIIRLIAGAMILCHSSLVFSQYCHDISQWPMVYMPASTFECTDYDLAFFDDFLDENGNEYDGVPNEDVWERFDSPDADNVYFPEQATVSGGFCLLKGEYTPGAEWTDPVTGEIYVRDVSAGAIRTKAGVSSGEFRYGKYEAMMQVSEKNNWKTAFWLFKHDEIDIMENFGSHNRYYYTTHSGYGADPYLCSNGALIPEVADLDGMMNNYAVEITPFVKTFSFNDIELPNKTYRFYSAEGSPLMVDCDNPQIPEGYYYINPTFMQIRSRLFRPLINFKAKAGYTLEDFDGVLKIDFMRVSTMDFNICSNAAVYGPNMLRTDGDGVEPYRAQPHCFGEISTLYVEDLNCKNYQCEVSFGFNDVSVSDDITLLSVHSNHRIEYIQNYCGAGRITIDYIDACGKEETIDYITPKDDVHYEIVDNNHCQGKFSLEVDLDCSNKNVNYLVATDKWNNEIPLNYTLDNGVLDLDLTDLHFLRHIIIEFENACTVIDIPLEVCDTENCCPEGSEWDGSNCYIGVYIPDGYEAFFLGNELYTEYGSGGLDMCPEGSIDTGEDCFFGIHFPQGYDGFMFQNKLYVHDDCSVEFCCPEGTEWNGKNCVSLDKPFGKGNGWIDEEGNVFLEPDETIEWCTWKPCYCSHEWNEEENRCETGETVPLGFEGSVVDGNLVLDPNCNTCCPDGFEFDGKECVKRIDITDMVITTVDDKLTTPPDCKAYGPENGCCPTGFTRVGNDCILLVENLEEVEISNDEATITREAERCDEKSGNRSDSPLESTTLSALADTEVLVYPNPFSDEFSILLKNLQKELTKVTIISIEGKVISSMNYELGDSELLNINPNIPHGIYIITITNGTYKYVNKLIKI